MNNSIVNQIFLEILSREDCLFSISSENKIIIHTGKKKKSGFNFLGTKNEAKLKPDTYEHFAVTALATCKFSSI